MNIADKRDRCVCGDKESESDYKDKSEKIMLNLIDIGAVSIDIVSQKFTYHDVCTTDGSKANFLLKELYKQQLINGIKEVEFGGNNLCSKCNSSLALMLFDKQINPKFDDDNFDIIFTEFCMNQFGRTMKREKRK